MIKAAKTIYMVGIKGFGMASLAVLLKKMGKNVSGSDVSDIFPTDTLLHAHNITIIEGFDPSHVPSDTDLVITTGAHGGFNNPEVLAAKSNDIEVMTHGQALGQVMDAFKTPIAICGTHGKTTTSALTAFLMKKLDLPLAYQVGAPSFSGMEGGDYYGDDYIVVESDEYVASPGVDNTPRFMYQNPLFTLCTSLDHDHVDVYKTLDDVKSAFLAFFNKLPEDGGLVYCMDDNNLKEVVTNISSKAKKYSYGCNESAFGYIEKIWTEDNYVCFSMNIDHKPMGDFQLSLSGKHNVYNAAGVLTLLFLLGFDPNDVRPFLPMFTGSKRRYEKILETDNFMLIDDYAHHPKEISETIIGTRLMYSNRRICLIFQPHTFSRTEALKDDFIDAISKADMCFLLDIYASAREAASESSITSQVLVDEAHKKGIMNINYATDTDLLDQLHSYLKPGDIIITAGATDIYKYHNDIINLLKKND